ncbi:uncharacterized protein LOC111080322 isoform X2 [Drosophila obscura]|uniref:uncharacterized protein LOC111080322 isoform X2 n=1 Tax=Drosophila obscura TaxID=7282 RepID=UPI001BB2141E|nr:uncharacterized protein LOC111080322 isoform X2 [Drosophila obscura]
MSEVSIFELPTECLFEIFKYIKNNCQRKKPNAAVEIKYEDFISLAICCKTFDDLIQEWNIDLYDRLWENVRFPRDITHIDFEDVNARLKRKSAKEKETYWRELSHAIRDAHLTTVSLRCESESFHSDLFEAFHTVIDQLQNKPNLKVLDIDVRGFTVKGMAGFGSLEVLRLNMQMDIDLTEICRLNKNLRALEYMNNETGGKGTLQPMLEALAANQSIVLKNLSINNVPLDHNETQAMAQRLECRFAKTQNAELLAQLPELEELTIRNVTSSPGSLQGLLAALASRESQTLQKLCLKRKIDAVEAKELTRLKSLRTLECQFADSLDILLLSQLPELEKLNLNANDRLDQILPLVLTVIKSCKKLAEIHIKCNPNHSGHVDMKSSEILIEMLDAFQDKLNIRINDSNIFGNREKNKLLVEMDFFRQNKLAIESLARVQSVNHMELQYHEVGELRALFAALAMRTNSNLQSLCIPYSPLLDFSETTELAKITSLTKFKGPISDIRSLQHLLHLSNFEVWNELEWSGQVRRNITFDKSTGKLTIINKTDNELPDGIGLNPLASLQNLRHVTISGVYKEGFMRDFLGQLATCQGKTLQTLEIFPNGVNYAELMEVIKLKSLRTLTCGLSHVEDMEIEQLEQLPHLAVLIVVSHRTGYLGSLLRTLAARKCPALRNLTVMGESLTPQEVTNVSAISSLERLDCGFCSTKGLDVLSQRNCIEHLGITTREGEASLVDLLTAVASSGESKIQNLTIDGPAVGQELATVLSLVLRIPRLKSLKLRIKDTQGFERLAEFLHLEELILSSDPERGSLAVLFRALSLKDSTKLKNLVIENTSIGPEEARHLVQVDSITSLKFGFKDKEIVPLLANMTNLENLEITTDHEFRYNNLAGHLLDIFQGCRKLKTINLGITPRFTSRDFLKKSLDVLKSVRDPATQAPLELRNYKEFHDEIFQMTTADETYLNIIRCH